jgi:hypothetical protein
MKKGKIIVLVLLTAALGLTGCGSVSSGSVSSDTSVSLEEADRLLYDDEMRKSFNYFYNCIGKDASSPAYGLVCDRLGATFASTAATGFGLAALAIGAANGYVRKEEASERALATLKSVQGLENFHGFYYHFLELASGLNHDSSEVSSIDSAILIIGALMAGAAFGGEVETTAQALYARCDWNFFLASHNGKKQFRMAYNPTDGTFAGYWDYYAEQLMLYVLGAGAPNESYRTDLTAYQGFTRARGSYKGDDFVYSWFGSLFTYQYSHAFIDFRGLVDPYGVSWYQNSIDASKAAYDWCQDNKGTFSTFGEGAWGLTACDTRKGYSGYLGNPPRGWNSAEGGEEYTAIEGTVAPCGALGSMPFTPEYSLKALRHYETIDSLYGLYGLYDSYETVHPWTASSYIGIDKGVTLVMMDNYLNGTIWSLSKKIEALQNGLSRLGFKGEKS